MVATQPEQLLAPMLAHCWIDLNVRTKFHFGLPEKTQTTTTETSRTFYGTDSFSLFYYFI